MEDGQNYVSVANTATFVHSSSTSNSFEAIIVTYCAEMCDFDAELVENRAKL